MQVITNSIIFYFVYPILIITSIIIGSYLAKKLYHNKAKVWKLVGLEASVIAIFGLILSFTLNSANVEYRNRTANINIETDALAQMYRASLFMNPDIRWHVKKYLINYTSKQLNINDNSWTHEIMLDSIAKINEDFIQYLLDLHKDSTNDNDVSILLNHHNKICTYFYRNTFSYTERTPNIIMFLLVIGSLLIGMFLGFVNSFSIGYKSNIIPSVYTFIMSVAIIAICDLDNPKTGMIRPDLRNMEYLYKSLKNNPD